MMALIASILRALHLPWWTSKPLDPTRIYVFNIRGKAPMNLTTLQKETFTFALLNKKGQPVQNPSFVGKPDWLVIPSGVASLFPSDDGLSCEVAAVAIGTCEVSVKVSANTSTNIVVFTGHGTVVVSADSRDNDPASLVISAGPVTDQ